MKDLRLSLKDKWFEMTKSGIKKEDYREITPYWIKRLFMYPEIFEVYNNSCIECKHRLDIANMPACGITKKKSFECTIGQFEWKESYFKTFAHNIMTHGYPSNSETEKILKYKHKGIEIRTGNHEWGAEPNKLYFVIKHGETVK